MLSIDNSSTLDRNRKAGKEESKYLSSIIKKTILDTDQYKRNVYYRLIALKQLCGFKKWTVRSSKFLAAFISIASKTVPKSSQRAMFQ